jgi:putative polyketide hydroxylase
MGPILGLGGCFYPSFAGDRTRSLRVCLVVFSCYRDKAVPSAPLGGAPPMGGRGPEAGPGGPPRGGPRGRPVIRPLFLSHHNEKQALGGSWGGPGGAPGGSLWSPGGLLGGSGGPSRGGTPRGAPWWPPSLRTILPFWSRPPGGPPRGVPRGAPRGPPGAPGGPFLGGPDSLGAKSS